MTESTQEAMTLLKERRRALIVLARNFALQIALRRGSVTTRDVRALMKNKGLLDESIRDFWLGAVFNNCDWFTWTGEYKSYTDESRNVHERTIKVWTLTPVGEVVAQKLLAKIANRSG